jgi:hypothetical protein
MLDHATGLVVGETARVGNNVSILQSVTLGGTGKEDGDRHPKICDGVLISAGAKILGNIRVGRAPRSGLPAASCRLEPVPPHTTVAGVNAAGQGRRQPYEALRDWPFGPLPSSVCRRLDMEPDAPRAPRCIAAGVYASIRAEIHSRAALNGVLGDHLEASANPLAIPMSLRTPDRALTLSRSALSQQLPDARSRVVVLVHGLCLSELNWWRRGHASLGDSLQASLNWTPLYLRYNTGRHISSNGRELARLLGRLQRSWPVPIESLTLVGHSMGGLVIRSACWYAARSRNRWLGNLHNVVCLGTPHHG